MPKPRSMEVLLTLFVDLTGEYNEDTELLA
jgi:hypothetical protein